MSKPKFDRFTLEYLSDQLVKLTVHNFESPTGLYGRGKDMAYRQVARLISEMLDCPELTREDLWRLTL